jgi:hypothetical protein
MENEIVKVNLNRTWATKRMKKERISVTGKTGTSCRQQLQNFIHYISAIAA